MGRGYAAIGLDNPKSAANVGSVLRAAGCFDVGMVCIGGKRAPVRSCTDTQKVYRHMPVLRGDLHDLAPFDCVPIAVDLVRGAKPLPAYTHPERAFYVFGAEDATLGDRVLSWCRDVIYVPSEFCLNLAACVNVVLYDRMVKAQRQKWRVYEGMEDSGHG